MAKQKRVRYAKYSKDVKDEILRRRAEGECVSQVAREMGFDPKKVASMVSAELHKRDGSTQKKIDENLAVVNAASDDIINFPESATAKNLSTKDRKSQRIMAHQLEIMSWGGIREDDIAGMKARTVKYFEVCMNNAVRPTLEGYGIAIGYNSGWVNKRLSGRIKASQELIGVLRRAKDVIVGGLVQYAVEDEINPATAIFFIKNLTGYINDERIIQARADGVEDGTEELDADAIKQKYSDMPD